MLGLRKVDAVVLAGLSTSGVVLSAVRDAWDRDYAVTVLANACGDDDADLHNTLMWTLLPRQATVMDVAIWQSTLG